MFTIIYCILRLQCRQNCHMQASMNAWTVSRTTSLSYGIQSFRILIILKPLDLHFWIFLEIDYVTRSPCLPSFHKISPLGAAPHIREIQAYANNSATYVVSCAHAQVARLHRLSCTVPHTTQSYLRKCLFKVSTITEHSLRFISPKTLQISAHFDEITSPSVLPHVNSKTVSATSKVTMYYRTILGNPIWKINSAWYPICHVTASGPKHSFPLPVCKCLTEKTPWAVVYLHMIAVALTTNVVYGSPLANRWQPINWWRHFRSVTSSNAQNRNSAASFGDVISGRARPMPAISFFRHQNIEQNLLCVERLLTNTTDINVKKLFSLNHELRRTNDIFKTAKGK
jgi:hypothetical protein